MGLDEMFSGKKTFTIIAMIVLLIGLIGDFISTIIWWNRIQPWFSHGEKDGKSVYQSLLACWVISLIGVILVIVFLVFTLFVGSICDSITGNTVILVVCIAIVGALSIGSIVSGAYGGSYGLKNPGEKDFDDEDEGRTSKNKCSKYIYYGQLGILEYVLRHPDKEKDFEKWNEDLSKHIVNDNGEVDYGYLCADVGLPTFIFAMVQCVAIILFIVDIIISCGALSRVG